MQIILANYECPAGDAIMRLYKKNSAAVIDPKCPSVRFQLTMFCGRFADTAIPGYRLCMLAKTHPDQASPVDPHFGCAGKRVKKANLKFLAPSFQRS